jgi:hypothetical protein
LPLNDALTNMQTILLTWRLSGIVMAVFMSAGCLSLGCEGNDGGSEPMATTTQLQVRQGTVGTLNDCLIGLVSVNAQGTPPVAELSLTSDRDRTVMNSVRVTVQANDSLPICGGYRRVVKVEEISGVGYVVLERSPLAVGDAPVPAVDAVVMTLGSTGKFVPPGVSGASADVSVRLISIAPGADGKPTARFEVWPGAGRSSEVDPVQVVAQTATTGGELALGARRYKVGAVIPGAPALGLPGYVEITPRPL